MLKHLIALVAFISLLASPAWAVTIINCQPCTAVSTTNVTCPKPFDLTVGQLLLTVVVQSGENNFTPPSGFTNPEGGSNGICGQAISQGPDFIYIAYKVATSADLGTSAFVWTAGSGFGAGGGICAYDYVGYSSGSPFDPNSNPSCNSNGFSPSTTWTADSITTGVNNSQIVIAMDSALSGTGCANTGSTIIGPIGYAQRTLTDDGSAFNFWMGDTPMASAGSVGNQSGTQSQNCQYNAIMFGLLSGPPAGNLNGLWPFP